MRKICVVTGSRAEYGLLKPLMDQIKADPDLRLQVVVTGSHLSKDFGLTQTDITKDFLIDAKVAMDLKGDQAIDTTRSIGQGIEGFGKILSRLKPDLVVLLGDRFEIFSAATAAYVLRIPVAHIHGGEVTQGAVDEAFRHAITKMSYVHFTSTEIYRRRVIQLGEDPKSVFAVGAIGLDNLKELKLLSKNDLGQQLKLEWKKTNLLVTYHPVTLESSTAKIQFESILKVLHELKDVQIIFTKANADAEGRIINQMIEKYVKSNLGRSSVFSSLGQLKYLSLLQYVDGMIGNSSSGIIEASSFKLPVINIGDRQKGRVKSKNIIDTGYSLSDIRKGIQKALSPSFRNICKSVHNPYKSKRQESVASQIKQKLKKLDLDPELLKKKFFDIH